MGIMDIFVKIIFSLLEYESSIRTLCATPAFKTTYLVSKM